MNFIAKLLLTSGILLFCLPILSAQPINPNDVTIVRDQWGVPHIYGKTDADAAYGMSYAHCEDNFRNIQSTLAAIQSRSSELDGVEGAGFDIIAFLTNVDHFLPENFEEQFTPEFLKVLKGSCQAYNDYAANNPDEILMKELFPVTTRDIIKGYCLGQTVMTNVAFDLGRLIKGQMDTYNVNSVLTGSNGFAFSRSKSKDGVTTMVSNTHQPLEGTLSWYEVHVNSEEGWNFLGATFTIGATPFIGTNQHLGWTHTVNYPDFSDIYKLEMHPSEKNKYKFDGEWLELEERVVKLKVKFGPIKIPVKKKFYWSKYGTTIKNKTGYYSVRYIASMNVLAAEQWYYMNKATNFEEFKSALDILGICNQNVIYGDQDDNIFYMCNGQFPYRNPKYNWQEILPGNTSENLWERNNYHPRTELAQIENPKCGYLFNCNNTPFNATGLDENIDPKTIDPTFGYMTKNSNRAIRFRELIDQYDKVSYEDIKRIKYDQQYSDTTFYTWAIENLDDLFEIDTKQYPDLKDAFEIINDWDRSTDIKNEGASLVLVSIHFVLAEVIKRGGFSRTQSVENEIFVKSIRKAKHHLKKHFGKLKVPLGLVQVHARGKKQFPVGGGPEIMSAMYTIDHKNGTFRSFMGDTFIMFAQYDGEEVAVETVVPYGSSNNKKAPHSTDQMKLYAGQKLKKMTLKKAEVLSNAVEKYNPGNRKGA